MPRRKVDEWFWQVGTDLQRMSEEFVRSRPLLAANKGWEPRVDVYEDIEKLVVRAEIAGVRGEEVGLRYIASRHSLVIHGVRREEAPMDKSKTGWFQLEIYYGAFEREVLLPDVEIDPEGVKAQYRNGFLTVLLPKITTVIAATTLVIEEL